MHSAFFIFYFLNAFIKYIQGFIYFLGWSNKTEFSSFLFKFRPGDESHFSEPAWSSG